MPAEHLGADQSTVLADRYVLGEVLGRGGMADVYRATDRVLARDVAVKVLRDVAGDESDRRRFTAEARTLAGLSNPGLVMVLDAGVTSERPFLVMELVEGTTLARLCSNGPLDTRLVASIGVQLADALAYAHRQGVVHRDVKPGNVLVGVDHRAKLADFGIARLIGDTVRHTQTGHAIGTAAYLAPEQVRGRDVGTAADVYSLGLVLLEALTGERAYPGPPTEAALARLQRGPRVPGSLPPPWPVLITELTAPDPEARPTAAEVAVRLRAPVTAVARTPEVAERTMVMSQPVEQPGSTAGEPGHPGASFFDRAGDGLAARSRALVTRIARMPAHQRGAAAAVVAVVALLVAVAVANVGGSAPHDRLPPDTPSQLQQPLQRLHDAVRGG